MPHSARAETLSLIRRGEQIPPPAMPELEPNSEEALDFLNSIEERHFAGLALVMDLQFEKVFESGNGLIEFDSDIVQHTGWQQLAASMKATFLEAEQAIKNTPEHKNARGFCRMIGLLNTYRHIDLSLQLGGGVSTGSSSTLTLLRNAPNIVNHHEPGCTKEDVSTIVRHPQSSMLLRPLAKGSINKMMAAQSALVGEKEHNYWSDIDQVLDPSDYRLHRYADGSASLDYANFKGLKLPAGYVLHETVPVLSGSTLVSDIPDSKTKVIGCPITLLQGRLMQLLNWGADLVEERNLWDEDWPAAK